MGPRSSWLALIYHAACFLLPLPASLVPCCGCPQPCTHDYFTGGWAAQQGCPSPWRQQRRLARQSRARKRHEGSVAAQVRVVGRHYQREWLRFQRGDPHTQVPAKSGVYAPRRSHRHSGLSVHKGGLGTANGGAVMGAEAAQARGQGGTRHTCQLTPRRWQHKQAGQAIGAREAGRGSLQNSTISRTISRTLLLSQGQAAASAGRQAGRGQGPGGRGRLRRPSPGGGGGLRRARSLSGGRRPFFPMAP